MNLLSKIKSNTFALWVAILSVVVQSFHSYTAFYNTSSLKGTGWGIAQAILFAIVIDLAILFYTVRNKTKVALGAAFVMVIINSYYYYQHLGISFQFIFGVFLALTIPTSVYFYSEEIHEEPSDVLFESEDERRLLARVEELTEMNNKIYRELNDAKSDLHHTEVSNKKLHELIDKEHTGILGAKERINELTQELFKLREQAIEALRLRDLAIQSESMTKQSYERAVARLKDVTIASNHTDAPEDKSLVNVKDDGKIISGTIPDNDLPDIQ